MFLTLIKCLCYINPYLLYVFAAMPFVTSGKKIRVTIFLYCIDAVKSQN